MGNIWAMWRMDNLKPDLKIYDHWPQMHILAGAQFQRRSVPPN